jgi:hypothetical protein
MAAAISIFFAAASSAREASDPAVRFEWMVKIPMRDGIELAATVYQSADAPAPRPCLFTLTPYTRQTYHSTGMYFASHGYTFLTVDVRGRGDSQGTFRPLIQEAKDGFDVVEWLAKQSYCNGKIGMWGGSYSGYDQWAAAKERPPHLSTVVPVASPYAGVDFPMAYNMFGPYDLQWLTFNSGHAAQSAIFGDSTFWNQASLAWFVSGRPFREFDSIVGNPSRIFQDWVSHPEQGPYWDAYNPTPTDYAAIDIPILAITGMYDNQQIGTLTYYRNFMKTAKADARSRYFLVIGPWDHAGTRKATDNVGGVKFGPNALLDIPQLHLDWYGWTLKGGERPNFLKKQVAYYIAGADQWRYADTLEAITAKMQPLYLHSTGGAATDVLAAGALSADKTSSPPDHYLYDPRDTSNATLEAGLDSSSMLDQTMIYAMRGKELIYHTAPMEKDINLSGFFRFSAWIGIDQPDTDFDVSISEILADGTSIPLSSDLMRARYRESLRKPKLVATKKPLLYDFDSFAFASRLVKKGSRLRLVIGPAQSISLEKNYNAGGLVAEESVKVARPVIVTLFHDAAHASALYMPIAAVQQF